MVWLEMDSVIHASWWWWRSFTVMMMVYWLDGYNDNDWWTISDDDDDNDGIGWDDDDVLQLNSAPRSCKPTVRRRSHSSQLFHWFCAVSSSLSVLFTAAAAPVIRCAKTSCTTTWHSIHQDHRVLHCFHSTSSGKSLVTGNIWLACSYARNIFTCLLQENVLSKQ